MPSLFKKATFSWKTTLVGLAGVIMAIPAIATEPTLKALWHDVYAGKVGVLILLGILGLVGKDSTSHGTPSNPLPPGNV